MSESIAKTRILHVVSRMNRGGIETWLMHVLRHIDRRRYQMDFLVCTDQPGEYDEEIRALGSEIIFDPELRRFEVLGRGLKQALRGRAGYDVLHCHSHLMGGYYLKQGRELGIPLCLAHCHCDVSQDRKQLNWYKQIFVQRSIQLTRKYATQGVACSPLAAESLFGAAWCSDPRWGVLYCGFDLKPFRQQESRDSLRTEFEIEADTLVIGHVGRFVELKNHHFLLQVAEVLRSQNQKFHFVLVGDGPTRSELTQSIYQKGLQSCFTLTGSRGDVPRLYSSLFDVFVLPSKYEGLGLVVVEALAGGCPAVIADHIPREADVVPGLVKRVSLEASAEVWAEAVIRAAQSSKSREMREQSLRQVESSPFNIFNSVQNLIELYSRAQTQARVA